MRGKRAKHRKPAPDPRYGNTVITRFVNKIMLHGKKTVAQKVFYEALETGAAEAKMVGKELEFLSVVFDNIRPGMEIKARRIGGANYQVPVPVNPVRQETLVIRWLCDIVRKKKGKSFATLLKNELLAAFNGEGEAVKKKEEVERMAEANKAFAHFKW